MHRLAPRLLVVLLVATLWLTPRQWVHVVGGRLIPPAAAGTAGKDRSPRGRNRVDSSPLPVRVPSTARVGSDPDRPAPVARRPLPPDPSPDLRRPPGPTPSLRSETTTPLRC